MTRLSVSIGSSVTFEAFFSCFIIVRALFRGSTPITQWEIRVCGGVHDSYTLPVRTGGIFYLPDRRDRWLNFSVSSERYRQSGVNGVAKVPKPSCHSGILTVASPSQRSNPLGHRALLHRVDTRCRQFLRRHVVGVCTRYGRGVPVLPTVICPILASRTHTGSSADNVLNRCARWYRS